MTAERSLPAPLPAHCGARAAGAGAAEAPALPGAALPPLLTTGPAGGSSVPPSYRWGNWEPKRPRTGSRLHG